MRRTTRRMPAIARRIGLLAIAVALVASSATLASSAPSASAPQVVRDTETVYAVFEPDGTHRETIVVDWLQLSGAGVAEIADPGAVTSVESLTEGFDPAISGDAVRASVEVAEGEGDYFYRASTEQPLPLDVEVVYALDGVEMTPDEIAGRAGHVAITYTLRNRLERTEVVTYTAGDGTSASEEVTYTVPLLCIPQIEIDGRTVRDVVAPEGAQLAVTGSTYTYAIPMVPSPEASATIEFEAERFSLDPVVISAFPTLPASPDFSVADDLADLRDGLSGLRQLSAGHLAVVQGMREGLAAYDLSQVSGAADGLSELGAGLTQLQTGAEQIAALASGQYLYLDGVIAGLDPAAYADLAALPSAITSMTTAASDLASGTAGLVTLLDGQIALAEQAQSLGVAALADAMIVAGRYPADPEAQAVVATLGQQGAILSALLDGGDLGAGYVPGLRDTRDQLADVAAGLGALHGGLQALETQAAALGAIPGAMGDLRDALVLLRDGGMVGGEYLPGLGQTVSGAQGIADGLAQVNAGLGDASADLAQLEDVPALVAELDATLAALASGGSLEDTYLPGIDLTVKSLAEMASGLEGGLGDIRAGEALTAAMERAADGYDTFLGTPEGARGTLTFLLRLDGIGE